jgi:hypothetical protein
MGISQHKDSLCFSQQENGGNRSICDKIMFDLAFFHREKLALDPVVLTRLTQEPPTSKGFKVPAIDAQGNKRVTYINAPIFVEFAFFAHYEGLQDRRALDDDGMHP